MNPNETQTNTTREPEPAPVSRQQARARKRREAKFQVSLDKIKGRHRAEQARLERQSALYDGYRL